MSVSPICAYCRHWLCSRDISSRMRALHDRQSITCHVHQPAEFLGGETCIYFEEANFE